MSALRLVLFDIDGTLLSASSVFREAIGFALRAVFGSTGPVESYDFSGKTDPQIVRDLMTASGLPAAQIDRGLPSALAAYRSELLLRLRPQDVRPKQGALALVERLAQEPAITLGLLTGNLESCARAKLEPLGLNAYFEFGAFGSDHEDRSELAALAVARALAVTGHRFSRKSIVVVGDSIHDVRCGRSLDVRAVAVATGRTSRATLAAEAPDAVLDDFADLDAALAALLG